MKVSELRNYGIAISEAESNWPRTLFKEMTKNGRAIVLGHLKGIEKIKFIIAFIRSKIRAKRADYSKIRARGMVDEKFLSTQIAYITTFSALAHVKGKKLAVEIFKEVMEKTAREAMLLLLPDPEEVETFENSFEAFREYFQAFPASNQRAGCLLMKIVEDSESAIQWDVSWCVWLELAKLLGVPEACIPNCYADELVFPDYFKKFGIKYSRTGTIALGATKCDFRFEKQR